MMTKENGVELEATLRCSECGTEIELDGLIEALQEQQKILDEILEIVKDLWEHGYGKFQIQV